MKFILIVGIAAPTTWALVWGGAVVGGFGMPVGDYGDFTAVGAVADARAIFCLTPNINLTAGAGYRFAYHVREDFGVEGVKYDVLPILAGADYRFEFLPLMPYCGGGFAVVLAKTAVPYLNPFTGEVETKKTDSVKLGGYADGGMEYYLNENFGVDTRGRFIYARGGEVAYFNDQPVDADNYAGIEGLVGFFFYP